MKKDRKFFCKQTTSSLCFVIPLEVFKRSPKTKRDGTDASVIGKTNLNQNVVNDKTYKYYSTTENSWSISVSLS